MEDITLDKIELDEMTLSDETKWFILIQFLLKSSHKGTYVSVKSLLSSDSVHKGDPIEV